MEEKLSREELIEVMAILMERLLLLLLEA